MFKDNNIIFSKKKKLLFAEELKPKPVRLPSPPKPVSKPAFQPRLMAPILKQTKVFLLCQLLVVVFHFHHFKMLLYEAIYHMSF